MDNEPIEQDPEKEQDQTATFKSLGVCDELCEACERLNFKIPTKVQIESLPYTLKGRDIIGLAETGSGKTLAFALPILQALLDSPIHYFAMILSPTRFHKKKSIGLNINFLIENYASKFQNNLKH